MPLANNSKPVQPESEPADKTLNIENPASLNQASSNVTPATAPPTEKKWLKWVVIAAAALLLSGGALAFLLVHNSSDSATTVSPSTSGESTTSNSSTSGPKSVTCSKTSTMYVTASAGLKVRTTKSDTANVITTMPWATKVTAGCDDGTWSVVTYQGQTDYAQTQYLAVADPSIFKIKEYNVQFKLTADLADLTYTVKDTGDGGSAAYFTSNGLIALDNACSADNGPLGAVGKYGPSDTYHDTTADQAGVPAIGGNYYIYESAQSLCSEKAAATALETTQLNSLKVAIKSLEASS